MGGGTDDGQAIRSVPLLLLGPAGRAAHPGIGLGLTHLGQTTNAAVAPLVVASPAYLSLVWCAPIHLSAPP